MSAGGHPISIDETNSIDETKAANATEGREIHSLTGLRAILAFGVVVFHFGRDFIPERWWLLKGAISSGYVAVDVFFVLSGYVLMRRYAATIFDPPTIRLGSRPAVFTRLRRPG